MKSAIKEELKWKMPAIIALAAFAAVMAAVVMVKRSDGNKQDVSSKAEKSYNVQVAQSRIRNLRPYISSIGTLEPNDKVIVSAEATGVLKYVNVDEGRRVDKGELMAMVDDTDYALEVRRAGAALRLSEATLKNAESDMARKEALYKSEVLSKQQYDDALTRLSVAEADLERAKAALDIAKEKLSDTKIYSPMRGVIQEKKASAGDYVRDGLPMFVVIDDSPLKLRFSVAEREIRGVKQGQAVVLKVDAYPEKEFSGRVNIVYPGLDEKTRSLSVEAIVVNDSGLLRPGMFANVTLYTGETKNTTVVPVTSILYEEDRVKVFVVEDGIARQRYLKIGNKHGEEIEVIEGVKAEEDIVVVGQQNLADGVRVNVAR